ncbi:protein kinase [Streptomyces uncialis]
MLAGRYRLGDVLGRGGMGTVWRAQDEILGRTVAVKELRFPNSIDEEEKRRLITRTLREAKAIARIRNNSAVTVYDVVDEDDRPWIVMELVEGKSLAEAIREDGLLTPRRAAEVGLAVLDVLRAAHSEGILHRDVKPSNVLIADDGRVVLTDFGIAQVEGDPSITSTGMLVGAPSYISPERARGHRPGPAADLWSLGGLLYASVEGIPPYDKGSAIATLTAVMTEPLDPPQNAGPLEEVIYGLLAKDPEQRLDDAGARALLTHVVSAPEETVTAGSDPTMVVAMPVVPHAVGDRKGERWGERKKRSVRKGAAGAAGAAGAVAPGAARPVPPPPRPAPAVGASASGAPATDRPARPGGAGSAHDGYGPPTTGLLAGYNAGAATGAPGRSAGTGAAGAPDTPVPSASGPVDRSGAGSAAPRAALTDVVPRRTLMVIAMVVAIAVIAGIVALVMRDDAETGAKKSDKVASSGATTGDDKDSGEKDDGAAPDGPTPGPDGASKDTGDGKDTEGNGTGSDPGKGTTTDPATAPGKDGSGDGEDKGKDDSEDKGKDKGEDGGAGSGTGVASTYKHSQGFSVGLPEGWSFRSTSTAGARFNGPGGQRLLIGWTSTPKSDAAADWRNQEGSMRRAQYERIRIESVGFRGWESADWEFTYVESGTKYRVTNRGFVVDSRQGYAIMYTAKAADWSGAERRETWQTFTRTFQPRS